MPKADILIVDDTPANLRLLSQMLTGQGYSVRAVMNGERALESAQTLPPDLILLDIRMPGLNGFEVCENLKASEITSEIPVIFISALDDIQDKVRGFQAGGVDYITKPFQLDEVLARTQTHLSLRSLQLQLEETNHRMAHELALAGKLQVKLLPARLPALPGWEFSACLRPARSTSGDFYNTFHLADGRLAVIIADVVDKGVGAALFMAYCTSLLRSSVEEHPANPELAFAQVNRHILSDTGTDQFVTTFLAVLDPVTGHLDYCNGGHPPGLLFRAQPGLGVDKLQRSGVPLGMYPNASWKQRSVQLSPGDLLLLYTDGITDASNQDLDPFGDQRLLLAVQRRLNQPLQDIQNGILTEVEDFCADTPQFDDIAIMLARWSPK